jgi:hypothetical protein
MTDSKTITDEDRKAALDMFAEAPASLPVPVEQGTRLPGEARVFGAQRVAVHRDIKKVETEIVRIASERGDSMFYSFKVNTKEGGKKEVSGPTIKLANEVARVYGNCDVDVRAYDLGESWLLYARFVDLETGYSLVRPFQARKSASSFRTKDPARADEIAFAVGVSKATRNVITNALQGLIDLGYEHARQRIVAKVGRNLPHYRERVVSRLEELAIDPKRVEQAMGRTIKKMTAQDVAKVITAIQGIADGMATADDIWPVEAEANSGVEKQRSRRSHKPEKVGAAPTAAPASDERPTLLAIRTKLWACTTAETIEQCWHDLVEPWWDNYSPQVQKQLEDEKSERLEKVK